MYVHLKKLSVQWYRNTLNSTLSSCVFLLIPESDLSSTDWWSMHTRKSQDEKQAHVAATASSSVPVGRWELQVQCLCSDWCHLALYKWTGWKGSSEQERLTLHCDVVERWISQNTTNSAPLWTKHWRCFSRWTTFVFMDFFFCYI